MAPLPGLRRVEHVMGMAVSLHIADPLSRPDAERLADDVFVWLREVDERFSTYKAGSEVSRFGRREISAEDCSADLRTVLGACADLWAATDGYFDAYATGRFDPSGYVKGWAVQIASDRLAASGAANHFLNAGGDVCVRGEAGPGRPWRVGIRHPIQGDRLAWVLAVHDLAVATSGTYERGLHVIDPHRGEPATDLWSVTVVGPDLALADAYATAALAMGRAGIGWLGRLEGHESAVITADGEAFRSPGLPVAPPDRAPAPDDPS